jgi:poly(3-hydroxyalkanoate) synthetase
MGRTANEEFEVLGTPIDLGAVTLDSYAIAGLNAVGQFGSLGATT